MEAQEALEVGFRSAGEKGNGAIGGGDEVDEALAVEVPPVVPDREAACVAACPVELVVFLLPGGVFAFVVFTCLLYKMSCEVKGLPWEKIGTDVELTFRL